MSADTTPLPDDAEHAKRKLLLIAQGEEHRFSEDGRSVHFGVDGTPDILVLRRGSDQRWYRYDASGKQKMNRQPLAEGETLLCGRGEECTLKVNAKQFSRKGQFHLQLDGPTVWVKTLAQASNKTSLSFGEQAEMQPSPTEEPSQTDSGRFRKALETYRMVAGPNFSGFFPAGNWTVEHFQNIGARELTSPHSENAVSNWSKLNMAGIHVYFTEANGEIIWIREEFITKGDDEA